MSWFYGLFCVPRGFVRHPGRCQCDLTKTEYPVRCVWPDGCETRSLYDLNNVARIIDGKIARPALTLEFEPSEIKPEHLRRRAFRTVRKFFGEVAVKGSTVPGSMSSVADPWRYCCATSITIAAAQQAIDRGEDAVVVLKEACVILAKENSKLVLSEIERRARSAAPPEQLPIDAMVSVLNEAVNLDREATCNLIKARVQCNKGIAEHPTIQVGETTIGTWELGLLGVLNAIAERLEPGNKICAVIDDCSGRLLRFERLGPCRRFDR